MDVLEAIKNRRSNRSFDSRPVEPEKMDAILRAGTWAPSPANTQPWEFVVISAQATRDRLIELSEAARTSGRIAVHGYSYVRSMPFDSLDDDSEAYDESVRNYSLAFLKKVPLIIGVVGEPMPSVRAASQPRSEDALKYACAAAIQNMLLAAHSLGLGSLWFTFFEEEPLARFLNVEPGKKLIALVCVGYAAAEARNPGRYPLESKVRFFDR